MITAIILIVCGWYWILSSFLNNTRNVRSAIMYKVIPFVTGVIVAGIGFGMLGIINIPV